MRYVKKQVFAFRVFNKKCENILDKKDVKNVTFLERLVQTNISPIRGELITKFQAVCSLSTFFMVVWRSIRLNLRHSISM